MSGRLNLLRAVGAMRPAAGEKRLGAARADDAHSFPVRSFVERPRSVSGSPGSGKMEPRSLRGLALRDNVRALASCGRTFILLLGCHSEPRLDGRSGLGNGDTTGLRSCLATEQTGGVMEARISHRRRAAG